jgi:hypothetical protein
MSLQAAIIAFNETSWFKHDACKAKENGAG